jgi:dihydrofolate reductase
MTKVIADITMSLDGYVTGPDPDLEHGLGRGGEPLHAWVESDHQIDKDVLAEIAEDTGAVVMGRRLFDIIEGPHGWSDQMGYGAEHATKPPFFVVTHSPPQQVRLEQELGMRFSFVGDVTTAVDQARTAAGDGPVVIMGGGDVIGQAIERGLVDELRLHLAPMLLGDGTPLFRAGARQLYRQRDVRASSDAVHVTYERTTAEPVD